MTATTSGSEPDPDGYGVTLDGGASQPLGINAAITLPNISTSSHQVELIGVALNCTVSGTNPRNVTVAAGKTASVAFKVTCSAPTPGAGSIEVTTATTGSDPDDGYTVTVDGGTAQSIGANATISLANVAGSGAPGAAPGNSGQLHGARRQPGPGNGCQRSRGPSRVPADLHRSAASTRHSSGERHDDGRITGWQLHGKRGRRNSTDPQRQPHHSESRRRIAFRAARRRRGQLHRLWIEPADRHRDCGADDGA